MKISHLGHFLRTIAFAAPAAAVELLSASPLAHLAWAPTALLVARWIGQAIGASGAGP